MPVATVGASLLSSGMSANAEKKSAKLQNKASKAALALQERQYDTSLAMGRPSYQLGQAAQGIYASALGLPGFSLMQYGYPGYQDPFTQQQTGAPANAANGQRLGNGAISNALPFGQEQSGNPAQSPLATYQGPTGQTLQQSNDATLTSILGGSNIPDIVRAQPGYQTQLDEGIKATQGAASATGSLRSGATLKGLSDYGQHTFGSYWDKWLGGIGTLAGYGQAAGNNIQQAGQANANNQGQIGIANAAAQGQAATGAANAWAEGLGGAAGALSAYPFGGSTGASPASHSTSTGWLGYWPGG